MNLSEQLAAAIDAQNALTQEVAGKMGDIDGRVEQFVSQWGVDGFTTLEVGAGKLYDSIQSAWDSLVGKTFQADALIKVSDGIYTTSRITLRHQPFAHRIRIEGNVANPAACQIKFVPDERGTSHGVTIQDIRSLAFSGFKLIGEASEQHWTTRCLHLIQGSRVWSAPGSIQIEGGAEGLLVEQGSQYECENLRIANTRRWAARIGSGARAYLAKLRLAGPGKGVRTTLPARIYGYSPSEPSHGLLVEDTAQCWAGEALVTDWWHGMHAARNGYLWCDLITAERCEIGCYAGYGGVCWTSWHNVQPGRPVERRSRVADTVFGFFADLGGKVTALGAIVERCGTGFHSTNHALLFANDSIARNCGTGYSAHGQSTIVAYSVNLSGCTTNFTPPNTDVPGNGNAIIRH